VRHPLNNQDFSSFLVQAQHSKAKIIGLADFGIAAGGQRFAGLLVTVMDINALGLQTAQGLLLTDVWYWDMNDANRMWTKRWQIERPGKFPTYGQAGVYSAVLHYLKAVAALNSDVDGKAVVALFGKGTIRADGRKIHPAYLFEVKKPEESKYPGDVYKLRDTIPADEAFRPMKDGQCPLING
jgi:branched-chain amino acid transport system substrate-binding protein